MIQMERVKPRMTVTQMIEEIFLLKIHLEAMVVPLHKFCVTFT